MGEREMRRLIAMCMFAMCMSLTGHQATAQEATPNAPCPETSEVENTAIVMRWYSEVLNGQNLDVIDKIIAEDADHTTSTLSDSSNRDGTRAVVSSLVTSYPDLQNTIDETIAEADLVVVRWTSTGTFQETFLGIDPTGDQHTWTGINIFRIECGLIAESWNEVDRLAQTGQVNANQATPVALDGEPPAVSATPDASCAAGSEEVHEALATRWYEDAFNEQDLAVIDEIVASGQRHHTSLFEDSRLRE